MFGVRLHPFYTMDGDIGDSPSVEGTEESVSTETASVQETPETTTETAENADSESSFAKRLREHSEKAIKAEREKWEKETSEKYKGHDDYKFLADYLQEANGLDVLTLKEQIELERLQTRADREQVSPEVLKRIDDLEAKAAKGAELEQHIQEEQRKQTYFSNLGEFVKDKGVTPEELNQFMIENKLTYDPEDMSKSFNVALRAMKAEEYEKKAQEKESETISRYLASKQAPRVEGSTGGLGVQTVDTSKMSWKDVEKHAAARLEASRTAQ